MIDETAKPLEPAPPGMVYANEKGDIFEPIQIGPITETLVFKIPDGIIRLKEKICQNK